MPFEEKVADLKDQTDAYLEGYLAGATAATEAASREIGGLVERACAAQRTFGDHQGPDEAIAERDRARETAVRLEQELAEAERKLDAQNNDLVKGVLLEVRRQGEHTLTEAGRVAIARAVERSAHNFRVTL